MEWRCVGSNPAGDIYIFILNFRSLPFRTAHWIPCKWIKHNHSPVAIVVLDPRYDWSCKALYIYSRSKALIVYDTAEIGWKHKSGNTLLGQSKLFWKAYTCVSVSEWVSEWVNWYTCVSIRSSSRRLQCMSSNRKTDSVDQEQIGRSPWIAVIGTVDNANHVWIPQVDGRTHQTCQCVLCASICRIRHIESPFDYVWWFCCIVHKDICSLGQGSN